MAAGLEAALGDDVARAKRLVGWLNVPADCLRPLKYLTLHPARPAGVNEPTEAGVSGARRILELVAELGPRDVCLGLISGGGSALLPAPIDGVTLDDKQRVTRLLSAAGANIRELNTVRKQLSRIKGGGLARACRAGTLVTLVISDVLGDPLDIIASGPTVPDPSRPRDALQVLARLGGAEVPRAITQALERRAGAAVDAQAAEQANEEPGDYTTSAGCRVINRVIGNNAVAVRAAVDEARRRGYEVHWEAAEQLEGWADDVGRDLVERYRASCGPGNVNGLITGGEPVVKLVPAEKRGKGGRNQQLVLAALEALAGEALRGGSSNRKDAHPSTDQGLLANLVVLSGGTDGEDGPTDAAGAVADGEVARAAQRLGLDPIDYLDRNDAYHFFDQVQGLVRTGPTHTNVCDIRVLLWQSDRTRGE